MKCTACGVETGGAYMCDQTDDDAMLCGPCFEITSCGYGAHGEGCQTTVFEMENQEANKC